MAKNPIKEKQYKEIMAHLDQSTLRDATKDKYKKIFTFLYYTGARINEVTRIRGQDIQSIIKDGKLKLLTPKTKRYKGGAFRDIPFSQDARKDIAEVFKDSLEHLDGYCIRSWNYKEKQVNIISLTTQLNKFLATIFGKSNYTTHSFRAGLLTEMALDNNIPLSIVQAFAGHKKPTTTMQYIKPSFEDIQASLTR